MKLDDEELLELAGIVSDGGDPDWPGALAQMGEQRRRHAVENLRRVADVVSAHKRLHPLYRSLKDELAAMAVSAPPPTRWGAFELRERIGRGAFGEVYRAWDARLEREVALKLLGPDLSGTPESADVIAEGRLMAKVRHPRVVCVFGADRHEGRVGIEMELLRGKTLAELVREQGPFGSREAALIGMDLCGALAAVHNAGLVHRDVKAENVIREEGGRIVLMDLGAGFEASEALDRGEGMAISGTPLYMAPEVLAARGSSVRSDIYSLGVLLFHLVTGRFPVVAGSIAELRDAHSKRRVQGLLDSRPDLQRTFVQVIERALAPDPDRRFQSAGEMESALAGYLGVPATEKPERRSDGANRSRPWWKTPAFAIAAFVAIAATALLVELPRRPSPVPLPSNAESSVGASYEVRAQFHRLRDGKRIAIENGSRVELGTRIGLEIEGTVPLYVYVVDEDERGHIFRLFPFAGLAMKNPIPAGGARDLPGPLEGGTEPQLWGVNTVGGREHILLVASPNRLSDLEADLLALDVPTTASANGAAGPVSPAERVRERLRGLGELVPANRKPSAAPDGGASSAPELVSRLARRLSGDAERAEGVWVRVFEFENPGAAK